MAETCRWTPVPRMALRREPVPHRRRPRRPTAPCLGQPGGLMTGDAGPPPYEGAIDMRRTLEWGSAARRERDRRALARLRRKLWACGVETAWQPSRPGEDPPCL